MQLPAQPVRHVNHNNAAPHYVNDFYAGWESFTSIMPIHKLNLHHNQHIPMAQVSTPALPLMTTTAGLTSSLTACKLSLSAAKPSYRSMSGAVLAEIQAPQAMRLQREAARPSHKLHSIPSRFVRLPPHADSC